MEDIDILYLEKLRMATHNNFNAENNEYLIRCRLFWKYKEEETPQWPTFISYWVMHCTFTPYKLIKDAFFPVFNSIVMHQLLHHTELAFLKSLHAPVAVDDGLPL